MLYHSLKKLVIKNTKHNSICTLEITPKKYDTNENPNIILSITFETIDYYQWRNWPNERTEMKNTHNDFCGGRKTIQLVM